MRVIVILLMGLVIASCSEFEDDEITTTIPIETFSVQNRSNLTIEFTASNSCGSMCWKRTYFEKTINGNEVIIKAYAVADGSTVCPAVCVSVDIPVSITLPAPGNYNFHFWKSDTSGVDTTILIEM